MELSISNTIPRMASKFLLTHTTIRKPDTDLQDSRSIQHIDRLSRRYYETSILTIRLKLLVWCWTLSE